MLTLNDLHCPICKETATKKGKNDFILCFFHGWVVGVKSISFYSAIKTNKRRTGK